jgi:hypothetical protein
MSRRDGGGMPSAAPWCEVFDARRSTGLGRRSSGFGLRWSSVAGGGSEPGLPGDSFHSGRPVLLSSPPTQGESPFVLVYPEPPSGPLSERPHDYLRWIYNLITTSSVVPSRTWEAGGQRARGSHHGNSNPGPFRRSRQPASRRSRANSSLRELPEVRGPGLGPREEPCRPAAGRPSPVGSGTLRLPGLRRTGSALRLARSERQGGDLPRRHAGAGVLASIAACACGRSP